MLDALAACPGGSPIAAGVCAAVPGAALLAPVGGSLAGAAADAVAGAGIGAALDAAAQWVVSGATWLLGQVGTVLSATTSVGLGTTWFQAHETVMVALAAAVVLPMACCAAIQAVAQQSVSMLVRTFLVYLPLSLLLTGVAVTLVRMGLALSDAVSAQILSVSGVRPSGALLPLTAALAAGGLGPGFVAGAAGLLTALAALVLWLELAVRAAAVTVAALFLPLALAALVWPAVSHWCRRLADTLVALILSKVVMVAVLGLGVSALMGGLDGSPAGGGFPAVVTGVALLVIATVAPYTLLRLVPAVEAGAVLQLEAARTRAHGAARPVIDRAQREQRAAARGSSGGNAPLLLELVAAASGPSSGASSSGLASSGPSASGPSSSGPSGAETQRDGTSGDERTPPNTYALDEVPRNEPGWGAPARAPGGAPGPGSARGNDSASGHGTGPGGGAGPVQTPPAGGEPPSVPQAAPPPPDGTPPS